MKKVSDQTRQTTKCSPLSKEGIVNNVLNLRKARGMSQAELAGRIGLTRQAMYAIEVNQYLPSTAIALRLARALECRVEDIFALSPEGEEVEAEWLGAMPTNQAQEVRVKVAQVGPRIIARPVCQLGDMLNFVVPADGIVTGISVSKPQKGNLSKVRVKLLHGREQIAQQIVIAGCDPSLFLAGDYVRQINARAGVTNWTMGSTMALNALLQGDVHMAGVHLVDARSGESNLPYLKRHVKGKDFVGVRFASWVEGLLVPPGNPKRIRGVEDLVKPGIQIVNREAGAGARFLLDALLNQSGLTPDLVKGYSHEVASHLEVARLIRDGSADAGIGVEPVARHFGLEFIPLRDEHYDLILRKDVLAGHPLIHRLFDAMASLPFRRELQALGGYNLAEIGKTLNW